MLPVTSTLAASGFFPEPDSIGFRTGEKGTHGSRTMMFHELSATFSCVAPTARRSDYAEAIIHDNCLAKPTLSTRRVTDQRLSELYALDVGVPLFRTLRRVWGLDPKGQPLLALLAAIARDPMLAATAPPVLALDVDQELTRSRVTAALRLAVGERLNNATLDKVARNAGSSWTQSGHLEGRTFKRRKRVEATAGVMTFALYLAYHAGFRSEEMFRSPWVQILDSTPTQARELAVDAKRSGLLDIRFAGDVVSVDFSRLESE
jgi:hypothetical protein